ncbi:cation diffusion facilitator family transporter [Celerinatantimonas diazotrophica]|uniref:cation diffusion facilitator family transporter n=1 Tax=Celerinatantimonas diazotrophica TaxID=412034 RepID=UPI001CC60172|nr:cation diffusion facilitator family transporter [Celerinatantimonas diazotrophica]
MADNNYVKLVHSASLMATLVALLLLIIKSAAYWLTGAVSILASQVDSLMDIGMSLVNVFAVRYALRPPDNEHRFGHGKVEPIAGLVQAGFIGGTGIILFYTGVGSLWSPKPLTSTSVGIIVMIISTVATALLVGYQMYVVKKTNNQVIHADSLHYCIDILMNLAVIVALVLDRWGWSWADGAFTIAIAAYVLHSAWRIGFDAFQHLLDRELDDSTKAAIREIALGVDGVAGLHDMRTRQAGQIKFIQFHIELADDLSLINAHSISMQVEHKLQARWPEADVIIHLDPLSIVEQEVKSGYHF